MAVAAAIGVGSDSAGAPSPASPAVAAAAAAPPAHHHHHHSSRLLNHKSRMAPPSMDPSSAMLDINSSIEKMSLDGSATLSRQQQMPQQTQQLLHVKQQQQHQLRRDSGWTNSTEGYGSMRSSSNGGWSDASALSPPTAAAAAQQQQQHGALALPNGDRRMSEVSAMSHGSNFSTTAVRSSQWCGGGDSRRSSMASATAQQQQQQHHGGRRGSLQPRHHHQQQQQQQEQMDSSGFNYQQQQQQQSRRASDPVRTLDRNFGVTQVGNGQNAPANASGGMSRHRSFTQLNAAQQQRAPLHGQPVRGMEQQQQQQQVFTLELGNTGICCSQLFFSVTGYERVFPTAGLPAATWLRVPAATTAGMGPTATGLSPRSGGGSHVPTAAAAAVPAAPELCPVAAAAATTRLGLDHQPASSDEAERLLPADLRLRAAVPVLERAAAAATGQHQQELSQLRFSAAYIR